MSYKAANHYWQIGADTSQFWSSAANDFVDDDDAAFLAWLAKGNTVTRVPTLAVALGVIVKQTGLLDSSDITMLRITEAVALGLTDWTAEDVVEWVEYRRLLREIASETSDEDQIPARPNFPEGT